MLAHDLHYNVVVMPDHRAGTNELCYSVQCPALGLSEEGETIDEALENIKQLIAFHLQSVTAEGGTIEDERDEKTLLTSVHVPYPA